jgi:hypothetical protein
MLAQRIGPLDVSKVGVSLTTETSPGKGGDYSLHQKSISMSGGFTDTGPGRKSYCDCAKRIYYDKFVELGDGRVYKGEWLANTKDIKDGIGVMFWTDGTKYEGTFHND